VYAGLQNARGALEVRSGVTVWATGCPNSCSVSEIEFSVAISPGAEFVPLDWAATANRTSIAYRDQTTVNDDMRYSVAWAGGNGDGVLDAGELATVTIKALDNPGTLANLRANDSWTLEIRTLGGTTDVFRSLPPQLAAIMQLH
jgi:hypothetical protein